jgi:hypothetical protein
VFDIICETSIMPLPLIEKRLEFAKTRLAQQQCRKPIFVEFNLTCCENRLRVARRRSRTPWLTTGALVATSTHQLPTQSPPARSSFMMQGVLPLLFLRCYRCCRARTATPSAFLSLFLSLAPPPPPVVSSREAAVDLSERARICGGMQVRRRGGWPGA